MKEAGSPAKGEEPRRRARGILPFLFVLALWQMASSLGWANSYLLPSPLRVARAEATAAANGELWQHIAASGMRVLGGFSIAVVLAFPAAALVSLAPRLLSALGPLLAFLRNIPPLALVPVLILWLGIGEASKLALIVLASFFPVFLGAATGLASVDPRLAEMGKSVGLSRWQILVWVLVPESVPSLANGLRLGLGYGWRSLVGAEMVAASSGLGYWILDSEEMARIDAVFAGILTIGLLGVALDRAAFAAARRLAPWARMEDTWQA